ncbi:hypothetical protein AJ79_09392 [Helicocarpus griseus UAMH5409]|uniref:protein-ribulosamine 3-kinase n=1 Tax=Helicocarpus griseus UAMH5409 TaxID=1447875 RepID=A0A2B7WK96_9EURO|nr:hypothetical protein AJ79_09392 [Helicocarpus griseus UAMH5409]
MKLDQAVMDLLQLDAASTTVTRAGGGCSSASAAKITTKLADGSEKRFFMKTAAGEEGKVMVQGEDASLKAIHSIVPTLCPQSFGWGPLSSSPSTYFLVVDYLDSSAPSSTSRSTKPNNNNNNSSSSSPSDPFQQLPRKSLAQKLAQLHTTPAPIPAGYSTPQFGFPVTTCCGDTPQDNSYKSSWAEFYAENRLRFILQRAEAENGVDAELHKLAETTISRVVPRLLGDGHLNNGEGVTPVVVHGDLWAGNAGEGSLGGRPVEEVIFDPSAFYGHGEFEMGIMRMFGGFGGRFLEGYYKLCPRDEPVGEYEDRVRLYELILVAIRRKVMRNQLSRLLITRPCSFHNPYIKRGTKYYYILLSPPSLAAAQLQHPTTTTTNVIPPPRHSIAFSTSSYFSNSNYNYNYNNHQDTLTSSHSSTSSSSPSPNTNTPTMSSDDAYAAFLEKANQDPSNTDSVTQSNPRHTSQALQTKTADDPQRIPTVLNDVESYYISDTDEVFEAVALVWEGAGEGRWPSAEQFKSLILPDANLASAKDIEVSIMTPTTFDPRNQYATVMHAVRAAMGEDDGNGEIKVYRVQMDVTRVEYWVIGLDQKGAQRKGGEGRIVGLRAKAVES